MNNEPAFPHKRVSNMYPDQFVYEGGMTLRDYFAGQALIGLFQIKVTDDKRSEIAYKIADAMLAEREKGQHGKD